MPNNNAIHCVNTKKVVLFNLGHKLAFTFCTNIYYNQRIFFRYTFMFYICFFIIYISFNFRVTICLSWVTFIRRLFVLFYEFCMIFLWLQILIIIISIIILIIAIIIIAIIIVFIVIAVIISSFLIFSTLSGIVFIILFYVFLCMKYF